MNSIPPRLPRRRESAEQAEMVFSVEEREVLNEFFGINEASITLYQLLGLNQPIENLRTIEKQADMRMAFLRAHQHHPTHQVAIQQLLNKLARARIVLLTPDKKSAYDQTLVRAASHAKVSAVIPDAVLPVATPPDALELVSMPEIVADTPKKSASPTFLQRAVRDLRYQVAAGFVGTVAALGLGVKLGANGDGQKADTKPAAKAPDTTEVPSVDLVTVPSEEAATEELPSMDPDFLADAEPLAETEEPIATIPVSTTEPAPTESTPAAEPAERVATNTPERQPEAALLSIDDGEMNRLRTVLLENVQEQPGGAKVDAILAFDTRELADNPAARKAVYVEALAQALTPSIADVARAHGVLKRMRAMPNYFSQDELAQDTEKVKNLAGKQGEHVVAHELLDDLIAAGVITRENAWFQKTAALRNAAKKTDAQRSAAAHGMLALAREMAEENPAGAKALLTDARKLITTMDDREERIAASKEAGETQSRVNESQRFVDAKNALVNNPSDSASLNIVGDHALAHGDTQKALDLIARSFTHPLRHLSHDANALLARGNMAGGKESWTCAKRWMDEAKKTSDDRKAAMLEIARMLMRQAVDAQNDPLDVISRAGALKALRDMGSETPGAQAQSTVEAPAEDRATIAPGTWVNAEIDVARDVVSGPWSIDPRTRLLKVGFDPHPRLKLPWRIVGDAYDVTFEADFVRENGKDSVDIMLPIGNGVTLNINTWPTLGGFTGLSNVNGVPSYENPQSGKGIVIVNYERCVVRVRVSEKDGKGSVTVSANGKDAFAWQGDVSSLTQQEHWEMEKDHFGIGSHKSDVIWNGFRILVQEGAVQNEAVQKKEEAKTESKKSENERTSHKEPVRPKNVPDEALWNGLTRSWYMFVRGMYTVEEAQRIAATNGAELVVPDSPEENAFVRDFGRMGSVGKIALGIRKIDGRWSHASGDQAYQNWNPGQPSGYPSEVYAFMNPATGGWDDMDTDACAVLLEWKCPQ